MSRTDFRRRKVVERPIKAQQRRPEPRPGWPAWKIGVAAVAALVLLGGGYLVIRLEMSPRYWTDEDLGPIAINRDKAPGPGPEGMVWVPGGTFWMGTDDKEFGDAGPVHKVYVDGFWMDKTEVTNAQFAAFVKATGYVTVVERPLDPELAKEFRAENYGFLTDYLAHLATGPDAGLAGVSWAGIYHAQPLLKPFSLVFHKTDRPLDPLKSDFRLWWRAVPGACWKHPEGPYSNLDGRANHPVVHICYEDAVAYAKWADKRLPTEAEWEFAARGGLDRKPYAWGDEFTPQGKHMANTWQGKFPHQNTLEDGYLATAPAGSYPPNGFGLVDMAGNVWEWCSDWYRPGYGSDLPQRNPQGPAKSDEPLEPKRVQRGGSFLCCDNYCVRYKMGARGKGEPMSTGNHIGFRCVKAAR